MTYQDFLFIIISIQHKIINFIKVVYLNLSENFIFKTIISMIIFSIIMWILFWCFKLLLSVISFRFYKETIDNCSEERVLINRFDKIVPIKASKKEKEEMREILKDFYNESNEAFDDSDNIDF